MCLSHVDHSTNVTADPNCTSDSVNPSVVEEEEYEEDKDQDEEVEEEEEEGLPSPPMDEAFFAAQTGPIELSQVIIIL